MSAFDHWNWMTVGVLALIAGLPFVAKLFSSESRERRKRRRSYGRIIRRTSRPVVMLNVRASRHKAAAMR